MIAYQNGPVASLWYFLAVGVIWCAVAQEEYSSSSSSSLVWEEYSFEGSGFYESLIVSTETPQEAPEVRYDSVFITSSITSRFATTSTVATFINNLGQEQEITFSVRLNRNSLITSFDMFVDGVTYHSEIVDATADDHITRDQENPSDDINRVEKCEDMFFVEASIAPGSQVIFNLTHREVVERSMGTYKHTIDLSPHLKTSLLEVVVEVNEPQGLDHVEATCINSNHYRSDTFNAQFACKVLHKELSSHLSTKGGDGILQLRYNVSKWLGNVLQTENNYFTYYFSPDGLLAIPKYIMFVIDISGSMAGIKLLETKAGIISILKTLPVDDNFNIVTFSNDVYKWKPDFVLATKRQVSSASQFINMLQSHGGTNIKDALHVAARSFRNVHHVYQSIWFLTDGVPTVGSTDTVHITSHITNVCRNKIAIFCIGLGNEVDESLLRNLARNNQGRFSQIHSSPKSSDEMQAFFQYFKPVLYDVQIKADKQVVLNSTLTRSHYLAYMDGQEILVAGQISEKLKQQFINVTVSGDGRDGQKSFIVKTRLNLLDMNYTQNVKQDHRVLEHLWALMRIKDLSHQLRTGRSDKITSASEMVRLSHMYGYVTPLTTLSLPLSGKSLKGDVIISNVCMSPLPRNLYQPFKWTPSYREQNKGSISRVYGDPHFVIDIPGSNLTICFDIQGKQGDVLVLIKDRPNGLFVNGEIIEDTAVYKSDLSDTKIPSLFGRLGVTLGSHQLLVSPDVILVDSDIPLRWTKPSRLTIDKYTVVIHDRQNMTVSQDGGVKLLIQLHTRIKHPSYFDFSLENNRGLSSDANGIFGNFKNSIIHMEVPSKSMGKERTTLTYNDKKISVNRMTKLFLKDNFCWHGRAEDFIGDIEQYTAGNIYL